MFHKIFFAFLICFSGACGAGALLNASKHYQADTQNMLAGAAGLLLILFLLFAGKIWFLKEPSK